MGLLDQLALCYIDVIISQIQRSTPPVVHVGKKRDKYRVLMGRPESKKLLTRFKRRSNDYLNGSQRKRMEWRGQVAICCVQGKGASGYIKCGELLE
jgi:hypothetical protein